VDFLENTLIPYPVLENHESIYNLAKSVGERLLGAANMQLFTPVMGAEDFSFFSQKIPAAMFMLGVGNEAKDQVHSLHSPYFFADEKALPIGAALHAAVAIDYLEKNSTDI
jgi:IAA-amino acid hydrolase